jgi:hypothetical protein
MFKLNLLILCCSVYALGAFAGGTYDDSIIAEDRSLDPLDKSMRADKHKRRSIADDSVIDLSASSQEKKNQVELSLHQINEELVQAKAAREEAERLLNEGTLIKRKRDEANSSLVVSTTPIQVINPIEVMGEQVAFDSAEPLTIFEIASALMPPNWEIRTDFHNNPEIDKRKYAFTSTKARDSAIRELLSEVSGARVTHQYMWDIVDKDGNPKPVLIISDKK